jgi:dTDP-4-amino-4,6-dideoxygalactose transaminase
MLFRQYSISGGLESAQPGKMPVAEKVTEEVLCLPVYPDLEISDVDHICELISNIRK